MNNAQKKRCRRCKKLLGRENFNSNSRSQDGLATTCRACVNKRRRELHQEQRQNPQTPPVDIIKAAKRGRLNEIQEHLPNDPQQLTQLLWKTVQDFHTIKKGAAHFAQARHLIERRAQVHWTMICEAARGGHQSLIDVLFDGGVETNIFVAAATGDEKTLTRLLSDNGQLARTNYEGMTPLHFCAQSALGKLDEDKGAAFVRCAEQLIQAGADINASADFEGLKQIRPLHCACWTGGNLALARLLLDNEADTTGCLKFALGQFHRHGDGHYAIAEILLQAGIDIHDEGNEILGRFAAHGDAKAVKWLLEHGADPNVQTDEGWTPLHMAAERNSGIKVVKSLLEHGADLNAATVDGDTPLDLARRNNKRRVAEFLRAEAAPA